MSAVCILRAEAGPDGVLTIRVTSTPDVGRSGGGAEGSLTFRSIDEAVAEVEGFLRGLLPSGPPETAAPEA